MATSADKVRTTRETWKEVPGGFRFKVRRPNFLQYRKMQKDGMDEVDIMLASIVGWDNVREQDVFPGGSDQPLAFDGETCDEWVGDHPEFWKPLAEALNDLTEKRIEVAEQTTGN